MIIPRNSGIRDSGFGIPGRRGAPRGLVRSDVPEPRSPNEKRTGADFTRRNHSGSPAFTLAEIMVTMVIIGIAAVIIIPTIGDTTDTQVVAAARSIAADLQYAQNLAITTQSNVYVVYNNGARSYSLSNNANASPPIINPITSTSYTVTFGPANGFSGLGSMTANFGGNATMYFDLLGAPHGDGTVQVVAGPHVYVVTVAPATGKITVASAGL